LLATFSSVELSEWRAFERVHGFGEAAIHDVLSAIHEQLQLSNHLFGAANFMDENDEPEDNPVAKPERYPRLWEAAKNDLEED
jgi:hypothetical protein